jgi:hypothetical protein
VEIGRAKGQLVCVLLLLTDHVQILRLESCPCTIPWIAASTERSTITASHVHLLPIDWMVAMLRPVQIASSIIASPLDHSAVL